MNRKEYADRMMDAVGKIDDGYIYEAQTYRAKKKTPGYVKAAIGLSVHLFAVDLPSQLFYGVALFLNSILLPNSVISGKVLVFVALRFLEPLGGKTLHILELNAEFPWLHMGTLTREVLSTTTAAFVGLWNWDPRIIIRLNRAV